MPKKRLDIRSPDAMAAGSDPRIAQFCENVDVVGPEALSGLRGPTTKSLTSGSIQLLSRTEYNRPVVGNNQDVSFWKTDQNSSGGELVKVDHSDFTLSSYEDSDTIQVSVPVEKEGDSHGEAVRYPRRNDVPMWAGPHKVSDGSDAHGKFTKSPSVEAATLEAPNAWVQAGFTMGTRKAPLQKLANLARMGYNRLILKLYGCMTLTARQIHG